MRNLEQLRVDVCYHQLHVVIVGVGSGFSYGASGSTHHSLEDISLMRSLPHMQVVVPADPMEAQAAVRFALESERPTYIRLGKNNEPHLHSHPPWGIMWRFIVYLWSSPYPPRILSNCLIVIASW